MSSRWSARRALELLSSPEAEFPRTVARNVIDQRFHGVAGVRRCVARSGAFCSAVVMEITSHRPSGYLLLPAIVGRLADKAYEFHPLVSFAAFSISLTLASLFEAVERQFLLKRIFSQPSAAHHPDFWLCLASRGAPHLYHVGSIEWACAFPLGHRAPLSPRSSFIAIGAERPKTHEAHTPRVTVIFDLTNRLFSRTRSHGVLPFIDRQQQSSTFASWGQCALEAAGDVTVYCCPSDAHVSPAWPHGMLPHAGRRRMSDCGQSISLVSKTLSRAADIGAGARRGRQIVACSTDPAVLAESQRPMPSLAANNRRGVTSSPIPQQSGG